MKQRARVENLRISRGRLCVDAGTVDRDFPRCPICSPASALSRASRLIKLLVVKAAVRNGATRDQGRRLVERGAGGIAAYLDDGLRELDLRAPGRTGRRQRIDVEDIVAGLNVLIRRALFAVPAQGHAGRTPVGRVYAFAAPMIGSDRALRSGRGRRDAEAAIRWLLARSKPKDVCVGEFVRRLYRPCGIHEAEFDLHWCGWNSERGRLRAGVPVRKNRSRICPTPADRPVRGPWSASPASRENE